MVAVVLVDTEIVVMVNVADVCPEATVTFAGTLAALELLESETDAPPEGAAPLRVTVPVEVAPPVTLVGLTVSEDRFGAGALTVNVAVFVTLLYVPLIVAVVLADTEVVVTVKVADVCPELTVTLPGTDADALLLDRFTVMPLEGAALLRVTV